MSGRIVRIDRRIVTYDIERLPGRARVEHRGLTIEGDFWDMNSWEGTIRRRLRVDEVVEWPRTLCVSYRWYGQQRVNRTSLWKDGARGMAEHMWRVFDEADIVVGYNHVGFDNKHMRTAWDEFDMPDPSPWKDIDLLRVVRGRNGMESKTLLAVTQRLDIETKTARYDVDQARAAAAGNRKAQREISAYCDGDVVATEGLYDRLRGKIKHGPHVASMPGGMERPHCPDCGSEDAKKNGLGVKQVLVYQRYRCNDCGKNFEGTRWHRESGRVAITRSA